MKNPLVMKKPAPHPKDVLLACNKINYMIIKYGCKRYKKKRDKGDRVINKVMRRYHLRGTCSEEYWRLKLTCLLIGE